jgi:glycosyltransferase involved in cell wall biosynthesis
VFNSTRGAELLKERTAANNITSILNGIKIERFLQNTDSTFYSKFNVPQGRKVFLLPSRIYPLKGHQILIEAISHLITDYPEMHVVFLGNEDRYFPGTKEFYNTLAVKLSVHNHITWIDFTNDVVPFIKNAYCVTLPSFSEGCPRVLLEALAASTPIIGSKIDGINEILDDGVNGYSFISKDSDSLAAAIRKLLSLTIEQYQIMKDNCLKNAEEKYDLQKMINQYQNLYLKLLKGTDI